jgi:hypothetical protein
MDAAPMPSTTEPDWTPSALPAAAPEAPVAVEPHLAAIFTGGLDYTPAYYRRGYLQDDHGLNLQPFASLGTCLNPGSPVLVHPYLTGWGSFGLTDLDHPMAHMAEGMAGVFVTWGGWNVDVNYGLYSTAPETPFTAVQELGLKVSYDVSTLWAEPGHPSPFALRPYAQLDWETFREVGPRGSYAEVGLEPAWRLPWGGQQIGLAMPVQLGLGVHDYYFNSCGCEEGLGYVGVGLSASVMLPRPPCGGRWFLSGSIQYLRLVADNLITLNHGEANAVTGKVGIGFSF